MAAEAIVSTVLEQSASIILKAAKEKVKLVVGVKKEIEKLTTKFEAIQAVLVDAEEKQVKDKAVGVWLDRLKAASYDVEDILDEWNTAILVFQIEEDSNAQFWKNVRFLFPYPCFCFRKIALRHNTGVKIKEINDELDSIAIDKDRLSLIANRSIEKPQRPKSTSFVEVSEIRGREEVKINLINKLLSESKQERASLPVISLVGLGGIGKTTLAQLAYNDEEIRTKFDHRVWVCVSDPFDEVRIARAILRGFKVEATNLDDEFQSLLECISENIVNKKFLLILDDVWTEDYNKWEPLYSSLSNGLHSESKILVTTRKDKVARIMKSSDVIDIGVLSLGESWSLFEQLAFCDRSEEECGNLEDIGRVIVDRCNGFPLAIKIIGSFLRFKKTREQWQRILESEIWKLESKELEKGIFHPLLLSYNDLQSMEKQCFLYCAIFPKDYEMEKDELIKLWMAQGYLDLEHDEEKEITGGEYFDTLAMHSFFQEFEKDGNGNICKCKMHDIVHDFAQFLVKNECFSKEIYLREEASLDVSFEKARHLMFILKSWVNVNVNIFNVQKLRSLLIELEPKLRRCFSPDLFEQMTCLRSLKLSESWDDKIPSQIGKLIHLRYLNMSRLLIKELPETLCCLYNLQTLDISWCEFLEKLPQGMGKLINLRHLIYEMTFKVTHMPKGMERLVCLRTLDRFIVGGGPNGMGLGCLKNLNKLQGRLKIKGLGKVVDEAEAKNAQLMNKKNLVELELWFNSASDIECNKDSAVLEALQPPPNLEGLKIWHCRSISLSLHWMVSLSHLKRLDLRWCINCEYLPANLGKLPQLESLEISHLDSVKRVGNEFVGIETSSSSSSSSSPSLIAFPKLKTLGFWYMENWEEWEYKITAGDITIMPSLSSLEINECPKLKSLPDYLLHVTTLEKLDIYDCNCEYLPALGKLPRLEYLTISGMESVKRVGNEFVGIETSSSSSSSSPSLIAFPKLKTLRIQWMENWEEWEYKITAGDITIMPSLSHLHIHECPKLKSLPDHLLHATTLERLAINTCDILEQVYKVERSRSGEKWSETLKKKIETCNEESNAIQNCP